MVLPVGSASQDLILLQNTPSGAKQTLLTAVRFVPLLKKRPHDGTLH
jgi:hypothetical protein